MIDTPRIRKLLAKCQAFMVPAQIPIPKGFALCCPSCGIWKMYPRVNPFGYQCAGPKVEREGYVNDDLCGRFHSQESIQLFIGLMMVKE